LRTVGHRGQLIICTPSCLITLYDVYFTALTLFVVRLAGQMACRMSVSVLVVVINMS